MASFFGGGGEVGSYHIGGDRQRAVCSDRQCSEEIDREPYVLMRERNRRQKIAL